jgi:hypothetical protein
LDIFSRVLTIRKHPEISIKTRTYGVLQGRLLTPVRLHQADAVRAKLEELGITQDDVGEAIAWARARA